ncbi:MAG: cytochrome c [Phycisphaerales bacterium]|nr:cytochrome c [Phycisphaerales bacterium]
MKTIRLMTVTLLLVAGCGGDSAEDPASAPPAAPTPSAVVKTAPPTTAPDDAPASSPSTAAGAALYRTHCGMCHGPTGEGDGPLAGALNPRPRGFVDEPWRFITPQTPDEARTAIADLIRRGLPQSGMPGYAAKMNEKQMLQVAEYVLELRR